MDKLILAGDVGGTKTALALYDRAGGPRRPRAEATFPSAGSASLVDIVRRFLAGRQVEVERASIGVAGPIEDNRVRVTNLPWEVDGRTLSAALAGAPVHLLNDLQATAHAVPFLEGSDLMTLQAGQPIKEGPMAVVAPGTGLGVGFLLWDGSRHVPHASEGGHVDFAPVGALQGALLAYLRARFAHVSNERVCSGIGVPNIYAFLKDSGQATEPDWLRERLAAAADQTPVIFDAAQQQEAAICMLTLDLFVNILARVAGDLALVVLATGGVYIGGGIPPRIAGKLQEPAFLKAFTDKGRFAGFMERAPLHIILKRDAALFGAACHALQ